MENTELHQPRWQMSFFTIWAAQAISLLGSRLVQFALVWWLTKTTGSATMLAYATLAGMLPGVVIAPFAGAVVDRWSRRLVMMVADTTIALVTAGLVCLFVAGTVHIWHIYVTMFIRATAGAFHWPAMRASTSLMVPERHLSRVAGLNQMLNGVMNIVSPPLGAVLLGLLPLQSILAIDVGTAACAVLPLFFIAVPQPQQRATDVEGGVRESSLLRDMLAGLRYLRSWPGALMLTCLATLINFTVNPAFSLMPILVTEHFGGAAMELSWLESAWGIGVVVGGLILSVWGGFRRRILITLTGLLGMGMGILVVGLTPSTAFWLALVAMSIAGFMNPITNGPVFAILQAKVDPEMQGRVFTVVGSITGAMSPLGMVLAGPVADRLGVRTWFVVGGIVCMLAGLGSFFVPDIVHIEDDRAQARKDIPTTVSAQ